MAKTTVASGNVKQVWDSEFFKEYIRAFPFAAYMGMSENNVFQVRENLTKQRGDTINFALVKQLTGSGVTGATSLKGNEEALSNYGHAVGINTVRNGVVVTELEEQKTEIAIRAAARTMLKHWSMDKLRDDIIAAMQSPVVDGSTEYADATEAQKDAWLDANSDRVIFGTQPLATDAPAGGATYDHSATLTDMVVSTDDMTPSLVSLAKRKARNATNGAIRPIKVDGGGEWYVHFMGSEPFRDLKENSTMTQANREAWTRGRDNPLFKDGDLLWDGVIVREVPEIPTLTGVAASSADAHPTFLCGAQAVGLAWAQRTTSRTQDDDYGYEMGVAIQEMRGIEKLTFNNIQHGMVTLYCTGAAD